MVHRKRWLELAAFLVILIALAGCSGFVGNGSRQFTLTLEKQGEGDVEPSVGEHLYNEGELVPLKAISVSGWGFSHWLGEVSESDEAETSVVVDKDKTVVAVFEEIFGWPVGFAISYYVDDAFFSMRLMHGATFPIGVDDSRTATVEKDYWIADTPVTYNLYYTVQTWGNRNGYSIGNGREGSNGSTGQPPTEKKNEPVTRVDWYDSVVWSNALSEMLGYQPVYTYQGEVIRNVNHRIACENAVLENTNGFRLLTSDEWELAARYQGDDTSHGAIEIGGQYWTPGHYASGATDSYFNEVATGEVAWYSRNSNNTTHDVGLKGGSRISLFDMSGNVWEWCFDEFYPFRLYRGGSFLERAEELQVGKVRGYYPSHADRDLGFRIAKSRY